MAMDMEHSLNFTDPVFSLFLLPPQKWGSYEHSSLTSQRLKLYSFAIFFVNSLVIFLIKTNFINIFSKSKRVPPLPPGPSPWPLVGNVPEMWRNGPVFRWIHRVMKELGTDIACFRLGKTNVITVTSPEIAREFLKKHDAVFVSRPITINSGIFSHGFLTTALTPWGDQWKKMRRVLVHDVLSQSKMRWMLEKRNEEADNLVRYIYNLSSINGGSSGQVVNVRAAAQHYTGSVMRRMIFSRRFFGKGSEDGGPGVEEQEHVSALFTVLLYLYAFSVADYLPWLRVFDLDEHEKKAKEGMEVLNKYQEVIVNERAQQWREGKKTEAEDLLDVFITLKDENGNPLLSDDEIKAQITVRIIIFFSI